MSREQFSNGLHATVYRATPDEIRRYEAADVVREEMTAYRESGVLAYLRHGIAHSLFPEHVLPYLAVEVEDEERVSFDLDLSDVRTKRYRQRHYSALAAVPPDHATYAAHMQVYEDGQGWKESQCRCSACQKHDSFHYRNGLENRAREVYLKMNKIGLFPPLFDPSDYCITESGSVFFFEIEGLYPDVLRQHLERAVSPTPGEVRALHLLNAYNAVLKNGRRSQPIELLERVEEYIL